MLFVALAAFAGFQQPDPNAEQAAATAWSECAERAAPFVARLSEPVEVAAEIAVSLCASESLEMSRRIDARTSNPLRAAEDMAFSRRLAGARARIRIVLERVCPVGDAACERIFFVNNRMTR